MTTRQRITLLSRYFPRREWERLLVTQLGRIDALDVPGPFRPRAPQTILHICAGNLAVSAETSLLHGLLLGSLNFIKLPRAREESTTRAALLRFIRHLPAPLRSLVRTCSDLTSLLPRVDAVIAFGSDATMRELREKIGWNQKFIPHGHAVSLLWVGQTPTPTQARACAEDILAYDQLGCLSPQAIYYPAQLSPQKIGDSLAPGLEKIRSSQKTSPLRPLSVAARIMEARTVAQAQGHQVWLPGHLGWTIISDPAPAFLPSPLHGVIYLRPARALDRALQSVRGKISTLGVVGPLPPETEKAFLHLGVTRFCPAGKMQAPSLTWYHDGRPVLADLVTWITTETP